MKGMEKSIEITCIECPIGCLITIEKQGEEFSVKGNNCPRGKAYAINEMTLPKRVLTTTVRCDNGEMVSVKTSAPVPKDRLFELMHIINKRVIKLPVKIGDVLINGVWEEVDLIATDNKEG